MITPPTPNNVVWATRPKTRDQKVTLNSNYFTYLCPITYDSKQFHQGHPPIYTDSDIQQFNANYQKQLSFNFCATFATKKKSALINKARESRLCDIDLNITPTSCSHDTTDQHKLPLYVLEDVLTCPVGCHLIVCFCAGADGNSVKLSCLDQAKQISDRRKKSNINTESWWMSGDHIRSGTMSLTTLILCKIILKYMI
jgi:hypothetical protein